MEQTKQAFNLISIINIESAFKREIIINEDYTKAKNILELNISKNFEKDEFGVFLTIDLKQEYGGKNLVELHVTSVGVFKKNGDISDEATNSFCDVNAPAIIFPFVREIIANLSVKGGLQPIIIQPINFVELSKQEKNK